VYQDPSHLYSNYKETPTFYPFDSFTITSVPYNSD